MLLLLYPMCAAVQHNAHDLRTPKHEGLYRVSARPTRRLFCHSRDAGAGGHRYSDSGT